MAISFSKMSDDEIGAMVRDRYERLCAAHDAGLTDTHPREQWNADSAVLRSARDEAGLGPVLIEKRGSSSEEGASDDVQPSKSANGNLGNGGATPAQDGRYVVGLDGQPRFEHANGRVVTGDAAIAARSGRADPARVRGMAAAIPGYNRIR